MLHAILNERVTLKHAETCPLSCLGFFPVLHPMLSTQAVCGFRKSLISAVSNLSMFIKDLFQTGKIPSTFLFSFISLVSGLWLMYSGSSHCLPSLSTIHSGKLCLVSTWLPLKTPLGENEVLLATSGLHSCSLHAETGQSAFRPGSMVAHTADLSRL